MEHAGSIAAFIQSLIGNVAAGSLFAMLTSAAMGGVGLLIVTVATVAVGAILGVFGLVSHTKNE